VSYHALDTDPNVRRAEGYAHATQRIPPSQKIGKKTEEVLNEGLDGEGDVPPPVVRLGTERVVQEMVEQELWQASQI
jgi:hypothetical protein